MGRNKPVKLTLIFSLFGVVALLILFQNCSNNKFDSSDEALYGRLTSRTISLSPNSFENRPKIQVTTILDNSYSMSPIQDNLRGAFANVTSGLRGFDGQMSLYTTDQGPNSAASSNPSYQTVEKIKYTDASGQTVEVPLDQADVPEANPFFKLLRYELPNSLTTDQSPLQFNQAMSNTEFDDFTNNYLASIENLGTSGSDREQGLCTLMRAINAATEDGVFHAYVIATNEPDGTEGIHCPSVATTPVDKVQDFTIGPTSCDSSSPDCRFSYQLSWPKTYTKELNYKERVVEERFQFKTSARTSGKRIGYVEWSQKTETLIFKVNVNVRTLTFNKIIEKDLIKITSSQSSTFVSKKPGTCVGTNRTALTCSASELQSLKDDTAKNPYGIDTATCTATCTNKTEDTDNIEISKNELGSCSQEGTFSCDLSQRTAVIQSLGDIDQFANNTCQYKCSDKTKKTNRTLNSTANCNGLKDQQESITKTCMGFKTELYNKLKSQYPALSGGDDFSKCQVTCSQPFISKDTNFQAANSNTPFCQGASGAEDQAKSWSRLCSGQDLTHLNNQLPSGVGVNPDFDCTYTCRQRVKAEVASRVHDVTCNPSNYNGACNGTQVASLPSPPSGSNRYSIAGSCSRQCYDGSNRTCNLTGLTGDSLCDNNQNLTDLETQCFNANPQITDALIQGSCSMKGGTRPSTTIPSGYSQKPGSTTVTPVFPVDVAVIDVVQSELYSQHGDQFFVAVFGPNKDFVGGDTSKCKPQDKNGDLDAARYKNLVTNLGPTKAQFTSVCETDFSGALQFTFDLITQEIESSYRLLLEDREFIFEIEANFLDGRAEVIDKATYRWSKGILRFDNPDQLKGVRDLQIKLGSVPK